MPSKKNRPYSIRLTEKNQAYLLHMKILDGRSLGIRKDGPDFNKLLNDCLTYCLETGKTGYSNVATPKELEMAYHDHKLKILKKQNDETVKQMQEIIKARRELEDELLQECTEKAIKETTQ